MTTKREKSEPPSPPIDEPGMAERFQRALRGAFSTPPKRHKQLERKRGKTTKAAKEKLSGC